MTYTSKITTIDIEVPASVAPHDDGGEPLRITVRTVMTQREMTLVSRPVSTMDEAYQRWAPFIIAWSLEGQAPPAEGGWEQLCELPPGVGGWLVATASNRIAEAIKKRFEETRAQTPPVNVIDTNAKRGSDC